MEEPQQGSANTAGGGAVALVASVLPWYVYKAEFIGGYSIRGTRYMFGWMGLVFLLGAAALVIAPAFGKKVGTIR